MLIEMFEIKILIHSFIPDVRKIFNYGERCFFLTSDDNKAWLALGEKRVMTMGNYEHFCTKDLLMELKNGATKIFDEKYISYVDGKDKPSKGPFCFFFPSEIHLRIFPTRGRRRKKGVIFQTHSRLFLAVSYR